MPPTSRVPPPQRRLHRTPRPKVLLAWGGGGVGRGAGLGRGPCHAVPYRASRRVPGSWQCRGQQCPPPIAGCPSRHTRSRANTQPWGGGGGGTPPSMAPRATPTLAQSPDPAAWMRWHRGPQRSPKVPPVGTVSGSRAATAPREAPALRTAAAEGQQGHHRLGGGTVPMSMCPPPSPLQSSWHCPGGRGTLGWGQAVTRDHRSPKQGVGGDKVALSQPWCGVGGSGGATETR